MHKSNGCAFLGGANERNPGCGKHGPRELVESYQKPGQIIRRLKALSDKAGPRGVWMRDAGWRAEKVKPKTRQQASLNACAHRAITYDMETVMVRKAAK